jgi:predicted ATPase
MVEQVEIENFKSIRKLKIDLAGLNVFIGANGSGKSNILEGVLLGAAASSDRLSDDFIASRGVRLSSYEGMKSAFSSDGKDSILISVNANDHSSSFDITKDRSVYGKWSVVVSDIENAVKAFDSYKKNSSPARQKVEGVMKFESIMSSFYKTAELNLSDFRDFIIYSPENNELRKFEEEGQTQPLGIHGAGLFKLLKTMDNDQLNVLKKNLKMIDWFKDFKVSEDPSTNQRRIQLQDRYIAEENQTFFDQRNANEGFLFLLFYMSLFVSQYTPKFFAIDNIDNALNPRLCRDLMLRFNTLSKEYGKQAIVTTHNPAILDGINLRDDNQRLYVVFRDLEGATKIKRVTEKMYNYDSDMLLSEAFSRGLIGGLNTSMAAW